MGTRCLTRVYDDHDKEIICLYRQFDGYPEGHGKELKSFFRGSTVVNGLPIDLPKTPHKRIFNGMECLAAQLVAHFKKEPGGFYLYPPGTKDVWEEYIYHVRFNGIGKPPKLTCTDPDDRTLQQEIA